MNKKMREILALIEAKTEQAKGHMSGESKDIGAAKSLLDEVDRLKAEFDVEKRLYDAEKAENTKTAGKSVVERKEHNAEKEFADAARRGFKSEKALSEGTLADGGYAVPQDIQTRIESYRDAKASLLSLVRVEKVTTNKGQRTFKKRSQQTGFAKVGENNTITKTSAPQFEVLAYDIKKYAGYFPITNELLSDSDANIATVLTEWIGDESRITANKLILEKIKADFAEVTLTSLDDIKKAINVTLGQAFKATSKIVTNDDGLQYLDTLKDKDGNYILQPNPTEPTEIRICTGATIVPVEVIPNADMPSLPTYTASTDTSVKTGKDYYTKGDGDTYSKVEAPTGKPSESSYYEISGSKIPVIIGDLYEAIVFWDRQSTTIKQSDVAAIGDLNAFADDLTILRAIEREDVSARDTQAAVNGYIAVSN